jgi:hypothetical protein
MWEEHPDVPCPHAECPGNGERCPEYNANNPPQTRRLRETNIGSVKNCVLNMGWLSKEFEAVGFGWLCHDEGLQEISRLPRNL